MLALIGPLLSSVASGFLAPLVGYYTSKDANVLAGFSDAAKTDQAIALAQMQAQVQIEQIKATSNTWFGARLITLGFGLLTMLHFGAVVFDSMTIGHHVVGSWGIAALPGPLASWEGTIITSFFVVSVASPPLQAITAWLHRN